MEIENKFCAFIDILGFKNKTKNFENAVKYYKDYIRCYDLFTSIDKKIFEDINGENKKQEEIEEIIFSDSIILYSTDWLRLIQRVANVMAALLELGFWFRGGIGYGKYYGDISNSRISMVSEGLVEAVELEEKKAIYPRIILSSIEQIDSIHNELQMERLLIEEQKSCYTDIQLLKFVDGISRVIYPAIADLRHPWRWDIGKNNKILCRK